MLNDLKVQLGGSVESVRRLFQRPGANPPAADSHLRSREAREEHHRRVRRMRRELYQLLEQHPTSRELMRHLDLVERTLRQDGFTAVEALPAPVIAKALGQLERLVWDWTPEGLAELRSRLAVIVKSNRADAPARPNAAPAAAKAPAAARELDLGHALVGDATELDQAAFEEMERSWSGQMPPEMRDAVAAARAA